MRLLIAILSLLLPTLSNADSKIEKQIHNSFLTLSAFECSAVAPNDKEAERLFTLGLEAGRGFIAFVNDDVQRYKTQIHPHVAVLWNMTSGPSPDFILGQLYADRVDEVYKEYSPDKDLWKIKRENMYRDKNCALLGK